MTLRLAAERRPHAAIPAADTRLGGRLPPPPALGEIWTEQVQGKTEKYGRICTTKDRQAKNKLLPVSGWLSPSISPVQRFLSVFGVAGRSAGAHRDGSVELGEHDAPVPG